MNDQYCILEKMQYGYIVTTSGKYHQTVCVLLNSVISNDLQVNIISVVHTFLGSLSLKKCSMYSQQRQDYQEMHDCLVMIINTAPITNMKDYGYYHVTLVVLATIDNGPYFV